MSKPKAGWICHEPGWWTKEKVGGICKEGKVWGCYPIGTPFPPMHFANRLSKAIQWMEDRYEAKRTGK